MSRASGHAVNPLPAPDPLSDLQRSGLARFSPRRWGLPSLVDWWPAYLLVAVLAFLGILVTLRLVVDVITPFAHVLLIAAFGGVLTISLAPLVARLDKWIPRRAAVVIVFFGTLLSIVGLAAILVWQLATEGQRLSSQLSDVVNALEGNNPIVIGPYALPDQFRHDDRWNEPPIGPDYAPPLAPQYFNWRKISIYGGSNEIQKNIIAKAILGL